jgi:phosphoesterase RecJ-like protein
VREEVARARRLIEAASNIAVVAHIRPDGDAVGSLLALTLSLLDRGQRATPILAAGLPRRFGFLPGAALVVRDMPASPDLLVAVDCSELHRLGFPPESLPRSPDLNIDHHPTNRGFAEVNLVDPRACATCEILHTLAPELGLPVTPEVATNLLAGIVTDTIGFRTRNVSADVLRTAANLVEAGAPLADLYERTLHRRSFEAARYWGCGLSRLERSDGLVWASLTLEDRRRSGYPGPDDADLINLLTTIDGAYVALLFVEQSGGVVKVSWRANDAVNVAELAERFGGGGHEPAAGAMIPGTLGAVQEQVLEATRAVLEGTLEKEP